MTDLFDPSRFLAQSPKTVPKEDIRRSLAQTVANCSQPQEPVGYSLETPEVPEICGKWGDVEETVATVATVATLPAEIPFSAALNGMFYLPAPVWLKPSRWRQLCMDARTFAEDHAQQALDAGWDVLDLFGASRMTGRFPTTASGLVILLRGRRVGSIDTGSITILNRIGAHNVLYRAHHLEGRHAVVPMWEAFNLSLNSG